MKEWITANAITSADLAIDDVATGTLDAVEGDEAPVGEAANYEP